MRKLSLNIFIVAGLLGFFAFTGVKDGGIQGKIAPVEGAKDAIAISGRDTLTAHINEGNLMFPDVKVGTYIIWIKGIPPYKDTPVVNVAVVEGATTDIGTVQLQQ